MLFSETLSLLKFGEYIWSHTSCAKKRSW